jgi:exodeoxyribonuclease VII small subunit
MSGYVYLPPGGPAGGFESPRTAGAVVSGDAILPSGHKPPACAKGHAARASKIAGLPSTRPMPRSSPSAHAPATYEQALAELEALVQAMEGGQMPLDQLLASYQRGAALLQQCRTRLQAVEDQVKLLEDGELKPWVAS